MEEVRRIMAELDWSPLWISMKTGVVATVISFFLGIYAARKSVQAGPRLKAVLDGILTLPMVLPPTVAGFFLLLIFSVRRPFGAFLYGNFDIKVVQSWAGCVIAATVIAFPLMYRNARAAFEQIDINLIHAARTLGMSEFVVQSWAGCVIAATVIAFPLMYRNARAAFEQIDINLIHAARTLGMSEFRIFWTVVMPTAGPGVTAGTILAFARALGEYGATSMGNDTGICPGARRIWGDFDAGGKYSGKDGNDLPEDRDGHSGW